MERRGPRSERGRVKKAEPSREAWSGGCVSGRSQAGCSLAILAACQSHSHSDSTDPSPDPSAGFAGPSRTPRRRVKASPSHRGRALSDRDSRPREANAGAKSLHLRVRPGFARIPA
eukprot:534882-Rhodomonas_salina.4